MRHMVIAILFLCVFTSVNAQTSQDDIPELNYLRTNNVMPIARFGWGATYDMAFVPDGETIVITTGAGILFYDYALNEQAYIPTDGHRATVIAVSPDGRWLATGGDDVRLWDIVTGTLLEIMDTGYGVRGLAFNADSTLLAVSKGWWSEGSGIFIFEVASGREQAHLVPNWIFSGVAFHPDGEHIIAHRIYDCCGTIIVIDINTGAVVSPDLGEYDAFQVAPSGDEIMMYMRYLGWQAFDLSDPQEMTELRTSPTPASGYIWAMSPVTENGTFSTITDDGVFALWDTETLTQIDTYTLDFDPRASAISPDGTMFAVVNSAGSISVIDMETDSIQSGDFLSIRTETIAFFNEYVFYVTRNNFMGYWNIWTDEFGVYDGQQGNINTLIVGYGGTLYSGGEDGSIIRWNALAPLRDPVTIYESSGASVEALEQDISGDLLVVICDENNRGELLRIDSNTGDSLGFSADGTSDENILPSLTLPSCSTTLHMTQTGRLYYVSGQYIYWLDIVTSTDVQRSELPFYSPQLYEVTDDEYIIVNQSVAFASNRFSQYFNLIVTHEHDITELAQVDNRLYVSAACAYIASGWAGDRYCSGVDMVISNYSLLPDRAEHVSLTGHNDTITQIIHRETLPVFISLSVDGTIILWGAPLEEQPIRRGDGARLIVGPRG